jgi:protein involved in polysaccharide export with SLBB domain
VKSLGRFMVCEGRHGVFLLHMLRKHLYLCLLLGAALASHAQFAKQNFAPQITTELSPSDAQKIKATIKPGAVRRAPESVDATDNQIVRALQNELARIRDSVSTARTRRVALQGKTQDSSAKEAELVVFGSEFFSNPSFSFVPGENFPTPENYVVGPGDIIDLVIFGYQETEMELKVSPEGSVNIPFGGVVQVSGLNLNETEQRIKVRMSRNGYQTLSTGESKLKLTIAKIRSINVFVVGAKNSGKYSIPSISGVMHALYVAGGPMLQGSFRNIELVRNGKVHKVIDLYDFMINGRKLDDVILMNNDIIRIPFFERRVVLEGAFKRPAIYELKASETYADAIGFAGGLTDNAFKDHILGTRFVTDKGLVNFNLTPSEWSSSPKSGDRLTARLSDGPRTEYAVVDGSVFNPGAFGWTASMTVANLLNASGGVHTDAFRGRGLIVRSPLGLPKKYLMFSLDADLESIPIESRDTLLVFSSTTFLNPQKIQVLGEVKEPGEFDFGTGLSLADALALSKGFTDKALKGTVVVSRSVRSKTLLSEVLRVAIDSSLMITAAEFALKPNDVIMVRPNPEINKQRSVTLEGEWTLPGVYPLQTRFDRLKTIYGQAEGLTSFADPNGVIILRPRTEARNPSEFELFDDTTSTLAALNRLVVFDTIALRINDRSNQSLNFVLKDGDRIIALERSTAVHITGAVHQKTFVMHQTGRRAKFYVRASGGFDPSALKSKTYVRLPNGRTRSTMHIVGFRVYPRVSPGSQVIVPIDPKYGLDNKKVDPTQLAVVTSLLGFLSTTTIAILQLVQ